MAKTKVSRKTLLKKPDEFITLSTKAVTLVKEHQQQFRILGIILVCLLIIAFGLYTYMKYINKKGQETYSTAYNFISKNMGLETNKDNLKESEELFDRVIDKYGLSKAARLAIPELAYLDFLQKRYDDAIHRYQEFLNKVSDDPYQSLAMMALAVCYEEKGDFEKAIRTLEQIRSGPDDFFKEQAMLIMARIYRQMNKQESSNEILEEFIEKFKNSPFLPIAKAYLKP